MTTPSESTVRPPFPTAPHVVHPAGVIAIWFTEPPGAIVQMRTPVQGNAELATWLVTTGLQALKARYPNAPAYTLVLDFSLMLSRDAAARKVMLDNTSALKPARVKSFVVPPRNATTLYLGSLRVAASLAAAVGVEVHIEKSLSVVISSRGLQASKPLRPMTPSNPP